MPVIRLDEMAKRSFRMSFGSIVFRSSMMFSATSESINYACTLYSALPLLSPYDRPEVVAEQDLVALHQALMTYVQTEFVEGSAELGMSCKSDCIALKTLLLLT